MDLNIDGLPIFNNSKMHLWPILGRLYGQKCSEVFMIGAYLGETKPFSANIFLRDFIKEFRELQQTGIINNDGRHFQIDIWSFICDAPARSFVCYTNGQTGFFSCAKCICKGIHNRATTLFPNNRAVPYTDNDFAEKENIDHHLGFSALETIGVKMVTQFPLEYLHLVLLGVTKRLVNYWVQDKFAFAERSAIDKAYLKLLQLNVFLTADII